MSAKPGERIPQSRLRNFSIIAHIDHGKSTLADRLLEMTHTIDARQMTSQVLDSMDLEREKGITIKARAVRLEYTARDGLIYGLNLIDTPGHVDFAYEVSHSLQACEGAILVVDAAQGIEAQTLANVHLALREDLTIIPVLNKIDLPSARARDGHGRAGERPGDPARGGDPRLGQGGHRRRRRSSRRSSSAIPPPKGDPARPLRGLIFDSHYDAYKGVIVYVRLAEGTLQDHDTIRLMASGRRVRAARAGRVPAAARAGQAARWPARSATSRPGSRACATPRSATRSPTRPRPAAEPLPGYQEAKSLVFAGIYPVSGEDYPLLRDALEKLHLNDASFTYEPESSVALGFGFRCGFLGLLHMEIVQERLEREFDLDLIASAPSVEYQVVLTAGPRRQSPSTTRPCCPTSTDIEEIQEPWVKLSVVTPSQYIGPLMELSTNRRGTFDNMEYLDPQRVVLHFEMPLAELIVDYFDQLKSRTQGYASMDYEEIGYRAAKLVKVDVLVDGEPVDALSLIVHRDRAQSTGRRARPKAQGADPAPDVRGADPGGDRQQRHRARDGPRHAQERPGQVLRWRHHPQEEAAREAERRQAADEAGGLGGDPAGGIPGGAADG